MEKNPFWFFQLEENSVHCLACKESFAFDMIKEHAVSMKHLTMYEVKTDFNFSVLPNGYGPLRILKTLEIFCQVCQEKTSLETRDKHIKSLTHVGNLQSFLVNGRSYFKERAAPNQEHNPPIQNIEVMFQMFEFTQRNFVQNNNEEHVNNEDQQKKRLFFSRAEEKLQKEVENDATEIYFGFHNLSAATEKRYHSEVRIFKQYLQDHKLQPLRRYISSMFVAKVLEHFQKPGSKNFLYAMIALAKANEISLSLKNLRAKPKAPIVRAFVKCAQNHIKHIYKTRFSNKKRLECRECLREFISRNEISQNFQE